MYTVGQSTLYLERFISNIGGMIQWIKRCSGNMVGFCPSISTSEGTEIKGPGFQQNGVDNRYISEYRTFNYTRKIQRSHLKSLQILVH